MLRRAALFSSSLTSAGVIDGVIQDDWEKINEICKAGRTKDFYPLGSYKPLELLNDAGTVNMVLAGVNKEIRADEQCLPTTTWISQTYTSLIVNDVEAYLPMSIREAIVPVWKEWANAYGSGSYYMNKVVLVSAIPNYLKDDKKFLAKVSGWKIFRTWLTTEFELDSGIGLYREATAIRTIEVDRQRKSSGNHGYNAGTYYMEERTNPIGTYANVCFCL